MDTDEYPYKDECYQIIGACMNVHNELGCGFLEAVYQEALSYEFEELDLPYEKEKILDIYYKNHLLTKKYIADYLCFEEVILELKAADELLPEHTAQILNYLKTTGKKVGLLEILGNQSFNSSELSLNHSC